MNHVQKMMTERAKLLSDARALYEAAPDGALSSEQFESVQRMNARSAELREQIDVAESIAREERAVIAITEERADRGITPSESFRHFLMTGEVRGSQNTASASGGYTIQSDTSLASQVQVAIEHEMPWRDYAAYFATDKGNPLPMPTVNDLANDGSQKAEEATRTNAASVVFGTVNFGAYTVTSEILPVSYELIEDSDIDVEAFLSVTLGARVGRLINLGATTGNGASTFTGVLSQAPAKTSSANTGITADEWIDAKFTLNKAYRKNAVWMMADTTVADIAKLKDNSGAYLFRVSDNVGDPDTFLNHPIVVNNDCPAIAANTVVAAFADLKQGFGLREVKAKKFQRLNELYAGTGQVGFVLTVRADTKILQPAAIKTIKVKA